MVLYVRKSSQLPTPLLYDSIYHDISDDTPAKYEG